MSDLAKSISFNVTCPRCGRDMRHVSAADPVGWARRERRAVLECTFPHCHHTVVVEVHLVDVNSPGGRPTSSAAA